MPTSLGDANRILYQNCLKFLCDSYTRKRIKLQSRSLHNIANQIVNNIDPLIVAKYVYYFRHNIGPNYIISLLQVLLMSHIPTRRWGKKFYSTIVHSPGEILEVFEIIFDFNLKPSTAMKNGYGFALSNFTEEELGAWQNWSDDIKLIDIIRLVHPKHSDAIGKLVKNKLKISYVREESIDMDALKKLRRDVNKDIDSLHKKIISMEFL